MDNLVQRIVDICKQKKIPVSQLEKDLNFGNGYLNPKKVSDMKVGRLLEILDYLGVSIAEFLDQGNDQTQIIQSAMAQIKSVSPKVYQTILNGWALSEEENDLIELYRKADSHDKAVVLQILSRYKE